MAIQLWGVRIKTQRGSYIHPDFVRRTKREAFDAWWQANVLDGDDWEIYTERTRNGDIEAVKLSVEEVRQ